jgi:hypothetical protein
VRFGASVFHWCTDKEDGFERFVPHLRAHAPALAELRVLASISPPLRGENLRTTVHWQRLLASVVHARRTCAWPDTIVVEIEIAHRSRLGLRGALALAVQEAQQKPELAALVHMPGSPRLVVSAREVGSDYTIERLLA